MKTNLLIVTFLAMSVSVFSQTYKKQFFEIDCNRSYESHLAEVDRSSNSAIISVREDDLYTCWYISDVRSFKAALLRLKSVYSDFLKEETDKKKEIKKMLPISFPVIDVIWSYQGESPKRRNNLLITVSMLSKWGCFYAERGSSHGWGKWVQLDIDDYKNGGINSYLNMDMDALDSLIEAF